MLALNGIVGITAQPHMISMCATGDSERSGRIGMTYGSLVKRLCTIGWALTGLIVAAMVVRRGATLPDPEMAFGYACRELLAPGLIGLMVACVTAANMSTCSNLMVNSGALFTRNFYRPFLDPSAPDKRLLLVGRISSFGLTLLGVLFALSIRNVLQAFLFTETIPTFLGLVILGGILWRRANRQGALAAILISVGVYYFLNFRETGELLLVYDWKPSPFGWSMLSGALALIIVSLLTRPEETRKVEEYFDNLERPSDAALPDGSVPRAAESGKDLLFYDLPGWFRPERWRGFWKRYREDVLGFLIAWGVVGLIVLLAFGIIRIGR
jgi:Na+/proline symporter